MATTLLDRYREICQLQEERKLRNRNMCRDATRLRTIFFPVSTDKLETLKSQLMVTIPTVGAVPTANGPVLTTPQSSPLINNHWTPSVSITQSSLTRVPSSSMPHHISSATLTTAPSSASGITMVHSSLNTSAIPLASPVTGPESTAKHTVKDDDGGLLDILDDSNMSSSTSIMNDSGSSSSTAVSCSPMATDMAQRQVTGAVQSVKVEDTKGGGNSSLSSQRDPPQSTALILGSTLIVSTTSNGRPIPSIGRPMPPSNGKPIPSIGGPMSPSNGRPIPSNGKPISSIGGPIPPSIGGPIPSTNGKPIPPSNGSHDLIVSQPPVPSPVMADNLKLTTNNTSNAIRVEVSDDELSNTENEETHSTRANGEQLTNTRNGNGTTALPNNSYQSNTNGSSLAPQDYNGSKAVAPIQEQYQNRIHTPQEDLDNSATDDYSITLSTTHGSSNQGEDKDNIELPDSSTAAAIDREGNNETNAGISVPLTEDKRESEAVTNPGIAKISGNNLPPQQIKAGGSDGEGAINVENKNGANREQKEDNSNDDFWADSSPKLHPITGAQRTTPPPVTTNGILELSNKNQIDNGALSFSSTSSISSVKPKEKDYPQIVSALVLAINANIRKERELAHKLYTQTSLTDDMITKIQDSPVLATLLTKRAVYGQDITSWDSATLSSILLKILSDAKADHGPPTITDLTSSSHWSSLWPRLLEHIRLLFQCGRELESIAKVFSSVLGIEEKKLLELLQNECGIDPSSSLHDFIESSLTSSTNSTSTLSTHNVDNEAAGKQQQGDASAYKLFTQSLVQSSHNSDLVLSSLSEDSDIAALQGFKPTASKKTSQDQATRSNGGEAHSDEEIDSEFDSSLSLPLSTDSPPPKPKSKPLLDGATLDKRMDFDDLSDEGTSNSKLSVPSVEDNDEFEFYQ